MRKLSLIFSGGNLFLEFFLIGVTTTLVPFEGKGADQGANLHLKSTACTRLCKYNNENYFFITHYRNGTERHSCFQFDSEEKITRKHQNQAIALNSKITSGFNDQINDAMKLKSITINTCKEYSSNNFLKNCLCNVEKLTEK